MVKRLSGGLLAVLLAVSTLTGCNDDVTERFREWNRSVDADGLVYEKGILHLPRESQPADRCVLGYPWRKVTRSEADAAARYVAGFEAEAREEARLREGMMAAAEAGDDVPPVEVEPAGAVSEAVQMPVETSAEVSPDRRLPLPDTLVVPLVFVFGGLRLPDVVGDRFTLHLDNEAPVVRGDVLELSVSYAGGCREHDFALLAMDVFQLPGGDRVVLDVILTHEAHFDPCDGRVERQRLDVSLGGVRERFDRAFAARREAGESLPPLALALRLPQGAACDVAEVPYDLSAARSL